ncbi:MAG: endonuclease/exonuclease/phosphatase family protein [Rhodospirillales bacterium]
MTSVLTWNIQCGKGVDNRIDLPGIASVIRAMADVDVICLQEVSRFNPDLDNGAGADQAAVLAALFPDHQPVFGAALDRDNGVGPRKQFGNMILSRLPVIQIFNHPLPQPVPEQPCKHMPRQALEIVVADHDKPFRVTATHLEYHSARQRMAQVERLRTIQTEITENSAYADHAPKSGPYAAIARPASGILCGDFNSAPDDPVYNHMISVGDGADSGYQDAWRRVMGTTPHAPTCGIYDHRQWPEGAHCRDFMFVTDDLAGTINRIQVDEMTAASDHQPVLLVFGD